MVPGLTVLWPCVPDLRLVDGSELPPDKRDTVELVKKLIATGNLRPLIEALRNGDRGPKRHAPATARIARARARAASRLTRP